MELIIVYKEKNIMEENMNITQLDEKIKEKNKELRELHSQRNAAQNHTLNEFMEKIFEKIDREKLYQNEDLDKRYIHTTGDVRDFPYESVFLKSYKIIEDYPEESELSNPLSDILSITFNIKYDRELKNIIRKHNWKDLSG